eukprot:14833092-Alexandrium_andersonii.AAC.1
MTDQLAQIEARLAELPLADPPGTKRLYEESRKHLMKVKDIRDGRKQELEKLRKKIAQHEELLKGDEEALVSAEAMHKEAVRRYSQTTLGEGDTPFT